MAVMVTVAAPMSRFDALIDACHKRARPIVMTTIAMGAGMVPLAVGWGAADSSFRSPMAVAVIGGLITSTVLSLLGDPVGVHRGGRSGAPVGPLEALGVARETGCGGRSPYNSAFCHWGVASLAPARGLRQHTGSADPGASSSVLARP